MPKFTERFPSDTNVVGVNIYVPSWHTMRYTLWVPGLYNRFLRR